MGVIPGALGSCSGLSMVARGEESRPSKSCIFCSQIPQSKKWAALWFSQTFSFISLETWTFKDISLKISWIVTACDTKPCLGGGSPNHSITPPCFIFFVALASVCNCPICSFTCSRSTSLPAACLQLKALLVHGCVLRAQTLCATGVH